VRIVVGCSLVALSACALGDPDAREPAPEPLDTILVEPPAIAEAPIAIDFAATRDASFECRVDDAPFAPCEPPQTLSVVALGPHVFEVRAVDGDDVDDTPARAEITVVENVAHPNLAVVEAGDGWYENGDEGLLLEEADWPSQVRPFYDLYPDDYMAVVTWTDFHASSARGVPFSAPLSNDVAGIGAEWYFRQPVGVGNRAAQAGSEGALEAAIFMMGADYWDAFDWLDVFWDGKVQDVLAQEFGHRWLSYMRLPGADDRDGLLDDWGAHWDFHVSLDAPTPMGYWIDPVEDHGDGTFTAHLWTDPTEYASLDLYAMGLVGPEEVADGFWVANAPSIPSDFVARRRWTFSGERRDFGIDDVIAANGPRVPAAPDAPKRFRTAFVLFVEPGRAPRPETLEWLDGVRRDWESFFDVATGGRGSVDTALFDSTRGL
jgi:hypothetical protein